MSADNEMWRADPIPQGWRQCEICDHEGLDVRPGMGAYPSATPGGYEYRRVTRCRKTTDCRSRCEANGDQWPLDDSTPRYQFVGEA